MRIIHPFHPFADRQLVCVGERYNRYGKRLLLRIKTQPKVVELVDKLLDDHIYSEIAEILNQKRIRPGGSARPGQADVRFTDLRVAYLVNRESCPATQR